MGDIRVSVPLADLMSMLSIVDEYPQLKAEVSSLRQQLTAMHGIYSEVLDVVSTIQDKLYEKEINTNR